VSNQALAASTAERRPSALSLEHVCCVLDRFGQAVRVQAEREVQTALLLETVEECLSADAVYFCPGVENVGVRAGGAVSLTAEWCQDFQRHLPTAGVDQVLHHFLDPAAKPRSPWPCSAALVCMSRAQSSWLAALSFHPRLLFGPADLQVMLQARRLMLSKDPGGR
jgi:hypothetical protein